MRKARGRWIALLDDDDEWEPAKTEKQIALAPEQDDRFVITCRVKVRFDNLEYVLPAPLPKEGEPHQRVHVRCIRQCHSQTSCLSLVRRQLLLDIPWEGPERTSGYGLVLRVLTEKGAQLKVVNEPLTIYWKQGNNCVSGGLDWRAILQWGRASRALLSPKAYSYFLARICANRAVQQGAIVRFVASFREFITKSRPTGRIDVVARGLRRCPFSIQTDSSSICKQSAQVLHNILTHIARSTSGPAGSFPVERLQADACSGRLRPTASIWLQQRPKQNDLSFAVPFICPGSPFSCGDSAHILVP